MKVEIKSRWNASVLFSLETESLKLCVEAAVKSGAYLTGAYLTGADLRGADLTDADLRGAYLTGADLTGADLTGAYLTGAYLTGAYLRGAYLTGAYLTGADGKKLTLTRNPLCIGPIGSRNDYMTAYATNEGIYIQTGCYFGAVATFEQRVKDTHGQSEYAAQYMAAIVMIRAVFNPTVTQ